MGWNREGREFTPCGKKGALKVVFKQQFPTRPLVLELKLTQAEFPLLLGWKVHCLESPEMAADTSLLNIHIFEVITTCLHHFKGLWSIMWIFFIIFFADLDLIIYADTLALQNEVKLILPVIFRDGIFTYNCSSSRYSSSLGYDFSFAKISVQAICGKQLFVTPFESIFFIPWNKNIQLTLNK